MRSSHFYLPTLKEAPADAEIKSHQLMLRAGMIRKVASGIYSWLPLGLRVLRKVETIVREEMNRIHAQEVLLPILQPAELWQESERWEAYGPELLRLTDRHQRAFCLGPTHEEIITALVRHEVRSYKQLPLIFYQIQTKFRDEIRPRFGVMRAREFMMKDAYSFHPDKTSLSETYQMMHASYCRIFTRLGLKFRVVLADTGNIGGSQSHEFQVLAQTGEDHIFYSDRSDYAANAELAESLVIQQRPPAPTKALKKVNTSPKKTMRALSDYLNISLQQSIQFVVVKGKLSPLIGLILRGNDELNVTKIGKLTDVATPIHFVDEADILAYTHVSSAYLGPIGLSIPLIIDREAAVLSDFVCGANEEGFHYINVNWGRDCPLPPIADLRKVRVGDPSPDGKGRLKMERGIEVGHIFQLGNKYACAMNARITTSHAREIPMEMGCYGIGISRVVGGAIEQCHDDQGIIWPSAMAPFQVVIIPIAYHRNRSVKEAADTLYQQLQQARIDVLLDDRKERPGKLFADNDLIGIPHRLVINEKMILEKTVAYKARIEKHEHPVNLENILNFLHQKINIPRD
ncbi:proline--tRNA ligase [Rickettsiella grylli]|uniref:Proline--tRNA ligase n=1 Tax=Rickettsiella grylli TaxID=59196 RepID=A8PMA6_9COXI|nr:proline--tRNA ligase [Rickettsiella grylli]EDP47026.1 prolyl-tRNA synthetase [Rickettsiella grylli]